MLKKNGFESVMSLQVGHDGKKRTCAVPFVDQNEKLCTLLEHPVVEGAAVH